MGWLQTFAISQSGMDAQRLRVEVAALNISNANIAATPGKPRVRPLSVVTQTSMDFSQVYTQQMQDKHLDGVTAYIVEQTKHAPRQIYEPAHPLANEKGMVEYPGINVLDEMLTLTTAIRAYEANIAAYNAAKAMNTRALDIGGQG